MISWRTTVDPLTASHVTSYTRYSFANSSGGGGAGDYVSQTRSANWSGTTVTEIKLGASTYTSTFITSNTFTRNIETSTVLNVGQFSFYTTSISSTFANWTTTGSGNVATQSKTRTAITTSASIISAPHTATTTLSLTERNPLFFATIAQAADTEVLWTASTSAATDFAGFMAASNVAATTSRVTIRPYLETVSVSTVNSGSTSQKINTEATMMVTYHDTSNATITTTAVGNALRFPMSTITAEAVVPQTLTTERLAYAAFPGVITGHSFATSAVPVVSNVAITATVGSFTYVTTQSVWSTISRWKSLKVALSSSSSESSAFGTVSTSGATEIGQSVTAFGNPKEQLGVVPPAEDSPAATVFAPKGFHNSAGFYSAPVSMEVGGLQIPSQSRGISTILPGTYNYTSGSQSGVVTISRLSGSYESDTTVSSFVLSPNGVPSIDAVAIVGFGGALGASETAFVYFPPGVSRAYVGTATSSFSTSGGFSSYSGSTPTKWFEEISFLQPGETGDEVLFWSAERNRTYTF
jgi:hypothetical protein